MVHGYVRGWYLISGEGDCGEGDCGEGDCGEGDCGEGEWLVKVKLIKFVEVRSWLLVLRGGTGAVGEVTRLRIPLGEGAG